MGRRSISWDDIASLEVDDSGRLYWNGKAVILEKRVRLERYQIALATMASVGALLAGIHPFGVTFGWW